MLVGDAELFLHLHLDRQAVAVPAALPGHVAAAHGVEARIEVLEEASPHVVDAGAPVGGGRTFVEHPLGRALAPAQTLREDVVGTPAGEDALLERDQVERGDRFEGHPGYFTGAPNTGRKQMARWSECYEVGRGAGDAVVLHVHVQPRGGRTAVVGKHGNAVKLRIAAPPVDDRANGAARELLARVFGVAPSAVTLVSGDRSRVKRFRLTGVEVEAIDTLLDSAVEDANPGSDRRTGSPLAIHAVANG